MRSRLTFGLCLALLPLLSACKSYGPRFDARQPAGKPMRLEEGAFTSVTTTNQIQPVWLKPSDALFRLGPGDTIEIEMLGETGSRSTALVGPDGKIYYNLLPGTFVWGETLAEVKTNLEAQLGKQMRVKPEVAVTLRGVESRRVWLLGAVQKPGVYPLATPVTLIEAISMAGGPLQVPGQLGVPDLERSFVLRNGQRINVNFQRLLGEGDLSQNLYLEPDDYVYLQSGTARNVYVLGAVPGPSVVPYSDRISLLGAIASCGGTLPYAQVGRVAIIRGSLVDPKIATVDYGAIRKGKAPDVTLQEGDIVYVSFVPYRQLAMLLDQALQTFVYSIGYNYGSAIAAGPSVPISTPTPTTIVVPPPPPATAR